MTDRIKAWLYKTLGLKNYLQLLQSLFLAGYRTGLLKKNEKYKWHYFVKKLIRPEDTIIDIGANLGYFSIIFSGIINERGMLFSVEPVKPYRDLLQKKLPVRSNIKVLPFALGDKNEGLVKLGMPPLLQHLHYLRHGTVTILTDEKIHDDQLIFEADIKRPGEVFGNLSKLDYVKCDIEGYETVVFPEMKAVLEKHKPLVQLETWGEQLPVMLAFFKSLGYHPYNLNHGKLVDADGVKPEVIASSDILFVPAERLQLVEPFFAS